MSSSTPVPPRQAIKPPKFGGQGYLLIALGLPLLVAGLSDLIGGDLWQALGAGGAFALLVLAALLTKRAAKAAEQVAQRLKASTGLQLERLTALLCVAGAAFLAAWFAAGHGLIVAVAFGAVTALGYALAYGLGEARKPGPTLAPGIDLAEVTRILEEATAKTVALETAAKALRPRDLAESLTRITAWLRQILTTIEEDPGDLRRARRFFVVYLDGITEVTAKYQAALSKGAAGALEANYRALLTDLEKAAAEQHANLLKNDTLDLDVQIEVLSKRLKGEGVL